MIQLRLQFQQPFFLMMMVLALCGTKLQALDRYAYSRYGHGEGGFDPYRYDLASKKLNESRRELADLRRKLIRLEQLAGQRHSAAIQRQLDELLEEAGCATQKDLEQKVAVLEKVVEGLETSVSTLASGRRQMTPEQAFFRGFAGSEFGYYDDEEIKTIWDALHKGFLCAVSKEISEFLRTKIRGVLQDKLGVLFDGLVNGISDSCSRVQEVVFHGGYKPFEEEKVIAWQSFVNTMLKDIENGVKENLRSGSSGQDMTLRNASAIAAGDLDEEGIASIVTQTDKHPSELVWNNQFAGYVVQFAFFSALLEQRKGYYPSESPEVFLASQIQLRIKEFSQLLLCVTTASDMDNYLAPNKPALPLIRSNLDNLFKLLLIYIKRRTFSTTSSAATTSIFDREPKATGRMKDRYDDFGYEPQSAWAR